MTDKYRINLRPLTDEEGGGWYAEIPDLPGCSSDGESAEEAITNLEDAKLAWIETAKILGRPIPRPRQSTDYSGKFTVRIARSLHRELALEAEEEGLSLNQYVAYILADRHRMFHRQKVSEEAATAPELGQMKLAELQKNFALFYNNTQLSFSSQTRNNYSLGNRIRVSRLPCSFTRDKEGKEWQSRRP